MATRYPLVLDGTTVEELQTGDNIIGLTSSTALQKGDGSSGLTAATAGTDYLVPPSGTAILKANSGGALANASAGTDYAGITNAQTFTGPQRGTITTDNDGSFDLSVTNNFFCTPTGTITLTFTNHVAGQSGYILLNNSGGYAITAAATTKVGLTFLASISIAGTYLISYLDNGTNAYCTASGVLS